VELGSISTADLVEIRALLKYSVDQPRDDHGRFAGGGNGVDVNDFASRVAGGTLLHNHPVEGAGPSPGDLFAAAIDKPAAIEVVPVGGPSYRLVPGASGWPDSKELSATRGQLLDELDTAINHLSGTAWDAAYRDGLRQQPALLLSRLQEQGRITMTVHPVTATKRDVSDEERDSHGQWTSGGGASDMEALGRLGDPRAEHQAAFDRISKELNSMRNPSTHERGMGNCYPAAYRIADRADELGLVNPVVCQGTCTPRTGALKDVPYSHAWVEAETPFGRLAYDYSSHNQVQMPADMYRGMGRLTAVTEYTPEEARAAALRTRHYGPWK
jgi:hypothetical protein